MTDWILRQPEGTPDAKLAAPLGLSPFLVELLWRRGLSEADEINSYLDARLAGLVNPDLWPQVPEAADFLAASLLDGKPLAIWGDYDVDGTTSTALVLDVLEFHGFHPTWHIPARHREGYGINKEGVEELAAAGCRVLLTVDSGIADVQAITRARELGMDVVVSDHHLPPETLPPANFFFNPRMTPQEETPCPQLAGVGVAFFLMAAVNRRLAPHTGRCFKMDAVLDLVALGTLADVMRLSGQNRILVRGGLKKLRSPSRPGLAALKTVSGMGLTSSVNAIQVSFKLAPRINAAGRMSHADTAVRLLRCRNSREAAQLARELDDLNTTRRDTERIILEEARAQALEQSRNVDKLTGLVLYGKLWHPGVIGIVATRIIEEFHVPCVIVCDDQDTLKGSARSVPGFDLFAGLSEIPEHLLSFGGHKQAAGVRILPGQLEAFRRDFTAMTARRLGCPGRETIHVDGVVGFSVAAQPNHLAELGLLEPFGPGNPEPIFVSNPLRVTGRTTFKGRQDSVDLTLLDTVDNINLHAKGWGLATSIGTDLIGKKIRIAFTLRQDTRFGFMGPEITIKDWAEESDVHLILEKDDPNQSGADEYPEASDETSEAAAR